MMIKNIWCLWLQGRDDPNMPKLNQICLKAWEELNPSWDFHFLDRSNVISIFPEFDALISRQNKNRSNAAKSDLIRLLLLERFGGVWVDASVYPMLPLDQFLPHLYRKSDFFAYKFPERSIDKKLGNRDYASWFLASKKTNNYIIKEWKNAFLKTFISIERPWKYYTVHETLCNLKDSNPRINSELEMSANLCVLPSLSIIEKGLDAKDDAYMYKRPRCFRKGDGLHEVSSLEKERLMQESLDFSDKQKIKKK